MKVKVKIAADSSTAVALRNFVKKVADAEIATTTEEVQLMAWMLEMSREISFASATNLRFADRGHEMVLPR